MLDRFQSPPKTRASSSSLVVLGTTETAHWVSLAAMHALRQQGCRVTGFMPLAHDALWHEGRWRSASLEQLQAASSFAFPTSALCCAPPAPVADAPVSVLQRETVVDSYTTLATWADVVVVDGVGAPGALLAPDLSMIGVAQALDLPVLIACDDSDEGLMHTCALVRQLRGLRLRLLGWVQAGQRRLACAAGMACLGTIAPCDLRAPLRAARQVHAQGLMHALGIDPVAVAKGGLANARKTGGHLH